MGRPFFTAFYLRIFLIFEYIFRYARSSSCSSLSSCFRISNMGVGREEETSEGDEPFSR